jgi:hypothetical protein
MGEKVSVIVSTDGWFDSEIETDADFFCAAFEGKYETTLKRHSTTPIIEISVLEKAIFRIGSLVLGESEYSRGFNDGVKDKERVLNDMIKERKQ